MFNTIKNALKTPEVRKRLWYTLLLIIIFRLGCFISVPTVDSTLLANINSNGITQLINTLTGGAFSRFSIFAMSITPYITASIVIQLLGMVIPSLERLTKEGGETERAKVNRYTKILTLFLSLAEGLGIYLTYKSTGIFVNPGPLTGCLVVLSFMTGTALLMWLGEQITTKGVGNGISMLIFVGIIAGLPEAVRTLYKMVFATTFNTMNLILALSIIIGAVILIAAVVFVQQAERRIPVQYSKKVVGRKMMGGQNTHIPLKLAMAGVMPIIFASSFMTFPAMIIQIFNSNIAEQTGFLAMLYKLSIATSSSTITTAAGTSYSLPIGYSIANAAIYLLLIVGFTFFYTYATFNPAEISSNIKKNGGFIPGIRTGKSTTEYLSSVISKLTIFGGLFLAVIAILPMLLRFTSVDLAFGGTSILIIVGVALETMQQLESQVVMKHYKGFLE
ncbi:MAG: preprotein translocase subunit SecY [Clostridia bacterium]|nr:preprotein translocase subunit SecY [Clostridia bacterium]